MGPSNIDNSEKNLGVYFKCDIAYRFQYKGTQNLYSLRLSFSTK